MIEFFFLKGKLIILFGFIILAGCSDEEAVFRRIRDHADGVKVINTHEHQHHAREYAADTFSFYNLLAASYLNADLVSAGADVEKMKPGTKKDGMLWDVYGESLDLARSTSYYKSFIRGFQLLYDFEEPYFTKANIATLSAEIGRNYNNYDEWFDRAFRKAGFETMFIDQYWKPMNTEIDTAHFRLAFNVGFLVSGAGKKPARLPGTPVDNITVKQTLTLDDYLHSCDELFRQNAAANAVCIKNAMAYSRTLFYDDVPEDEARLLYQKELLTPEESRKIEDFMFHYIIKKAIEYDWPIQVHTGYLAGNGGSLENGHPVKLNNLFLQYPEAKFVLLHGGFPWTGECVALAKMFPNVYLDLVWLPQISRQEAVNMLEVMLDCVPYNKICWGGDCQLIEESAGALALAKDVVSEVLASRVERGLLTEEVSLEIIERIFRENAIEIYALSP